MKVGKMEAMPPFKYKNLTADDQVKGSPGYLKGIIIGAVTTNGTLTICDALTETTPTVAALALVTRAAGSQLPLYIPLEVECQTGIYFGFDATLAANITAIYK